MRRITIKSEKPSTRCEICHQSDLFNTEAEYCLRCNIENRPNFRNNSNVFNNSILTNNSIEVTVSLELWDWEVTVRELNDRLFDLCLLLIPVIYILITNSIIQSGYNYFIAFLLYPVFVIYKLISRQIPTFDSMEKETTYIFNKYGYKANSGMIRWNGIWEDFKKVKETKHSLIFFLPVSPNFIIPKRFFQKEELNELKSIIN